jgi:HAMP domain-containing protein
MEEFGRNDDWIKEKKDSLLKGNAESKSDTVFLYSLAMNQNISYRRTSERQLYDMGVKAKELAAQKIHHIMEIDNINGEIDALNKEKREMTRSILITNEPAASPDPVKSRTKIIILSAGFASLLIFVSLAFFIEDFTVRR